MKRKSFGLILTLALVAPAGPGVAAALKAVPSQLDPAKAYILVEYELPPNPSASPGSGKTLALTSGLVFARYDPSLGDVRGRGRAAKNPVPAEQKAIEEFREAIIAKRKGRSLQLIEVEPDTWVILGWGRHTSFSRGSYTFTLVPGSVTDLGVVVGERDWAEDAKSVASRANMWKASLLELEAKAGHVPPMRVRFRPRTSADLPVPAGLPADKVQPVTFTPGAKFRNYGGGAPSRIEGENGRADR